MSNFSLHTHLTPDEHFRIHGTLAPEQVAEFMETIIHEDTKDEVHDMLRDLEVPSVSEFDDVLAGLAEAKPEASLVADLRDLLQNHFQEGERAMVLLGKVEEDLESTNYAIDQAVVSVKALRDLTEKFAETFHSVLTEVDDKLGL